MTNMFFGLFSNSEKEAKAEEIKVTYNEKRKELIDYAITQIDSSIETAIKFNWKHYIDGALRDIVKEALNQNEEYQKLLKDAAAIALEEIKSSKEIRDKIKEETVYILTNFTGHVSYENIYREAVQEGFRNHVKNSVSKSLGISETEK